jgi:hypothetical protein
LKNSEAADQKVDDLYKAECVVPADALDHSSAGAFPALAEHKAESRDTHSGL